jgi:shikimate kinase
MGSGKTTTGKILASHLGFQFQDTDSVVEERAGCRISEYFRERGEASIRELEREVLRELASRDGQVLATGGGLWMKRLNREILLSSGWCVWLKVGPLTAWERVKPNLPDRPLLASAEQPMEKIRALLAERDPLYALAHHQEDTEGRTPDEVSKRILQNLKELGPFDLPPLPS